MIIEFKIEDKTVKVDLSKPMSLSIPLKNGDKNPNAFYAPIPKIEPVKTEHFIGSTEQGGLVNFKNVFINPHGNGTHTECVGHIAKETYRININLKMYHFICNIITIKPEHQNGDYVITRQQLEGKRLEKGITAIAIRTLPNSIEKFSKNWSGSNPPYIDSAAVDYLVEFGIEHLLIDLPSVDREEDDGKLLAHKAFWNYPSNAVREKCTITEMIYVDDFIKDGLYLLNIQIAPLELDVSPSNIVVYKVF